MTAADTSSVLTCLRDIIGLVHAASVQARECHWNVRGMTFGPLHTLFGDAYSELSDVEDTLAERVRALAGYVPTTCINAAFPIESVATKTDKVMLETMKTVYGRLTACLRQAIMEYNAADSVTTNMLQDICARFEKRAWMLRAHLL